MAGEAARTSFVDIEEFFVKVKPLTTDLSELEAAVSQFSVVDCENCGVARGPRTSVGTATEHGHEA